MTRQGGGGRFGLFGVEGERDLEVRGGRRDICWGLLALAMFPVSLPDYPFFMVDLTRVRFHLFTSCWLYIASRRAGEYCDAWRKEFTQRYNYSYVSRQICLTLRQMPWDACKGPRWTPSG